VAHSAFQHFSASSFMNRCYYTFYVDGIKMVKTKKSLITARQIVAKFVTQKVTIVTA